MALKSCVNALPKALLARKGTTISIPVVNVIGYLHNVRDLPDGRDLNRAFQEIEKAPLAGQIANQLTHEVLPYVDLVIDFHTGGAQRFNAPQIRINSGNDALVKQAKILGTPLSYTANPCRSRFAILVTKKAFLFYCLKGVKAMILRLR